MQLCILQPQPTGLAFCWGWSSDPSVQKINHRAKTNHRCKSIFHIVTFNIGTLSPTNQLPELTVSGTKQKCIQEHTYYHREVKIKYHDPSNGRILMSVSAWENTVNVIIWGVGMLSSPGALKSLNSIERIQWRFLCALLTGNPCTAIISRYEGFECFKIFHGTIQTHRNFKSA